jgi:hypothetical protein
MFSNLWSSYLDFLPLIESYYLCSILLSSVGLPLYANDHRYDTFITFIQFYYGSNIFYFFKKLTIKYVKKINLIINLKKKKILKVVQIL